MSSAVYRFTATAIPGSAITFGLMLFMVALVATTHKDPAADPPAIPLSAIFMDDPVPKAFPKPPKPERITEVAAPTTTAPRSIDLPQTGTLSTDPGISHTLEVPVISPTTTNSNYIPVYVPQPNFPLKALERGVSGYAVVEVTITTAGGVRQPAVVEEYPEGYGFGKAALKAAERLKYSPKMVDGQPMEVPGVMYKFSFNVAD